MNDIRRFIDILRESYLTTVSLRGMHCEVFKNPSRKEYAAAMGEYAQVRAWLVGDDCLIWNINLLHAEIYDELKLPNTAIPVQIFGRPGKEVDVLVTDASQRTKWFHNPTVASAIFANSYLERTFLDIDNVSYFDEDIVGDWADLRDDEDR